MDEIDEMGEIGLHFALLACATSLSIEGYLPSKVVFHQRSSSIEGVLPTLGHFYFWVLVLSVA